jgi:hypothetical protein
VAFIDLHLPYTFPQGTCGGAIDFNLTILPPWWYV